MYSIPTIETIKYLHLRKDSVIDEFCFRRIYYILCPDFEVARPLFFVSLSYFCDAGPSNMLSPNASYFGLVTFGHNGHIFQPNAFTFWSYIRRFTVVLGQTYNTFCNIKRKIICKKPVHIDIFICF